MVKSNISATNVNLQHKNLLLVFPKGNTEIGGQKNSTKFADILNQIALFILYKMDQLHAKDAGGIKIRSDSMVLNILLQYLWSTHENLWKNIRLETKSCRILQLTYGTKYDMT